MVGCEKVKRLAPR